MQPYQRTDIIQYSRLLANSFANWTKTPLVQCTANDEAEFSKQLYQAPFILVSHGTEADPVFRYANLAAQQLFGMDWQVFTKLPSRLSAKPDAQEDRERLLVQAREHGFVNNYSGVRVTSKGKLFFISDTILWNVVDESGMRHGQAAMFTNVKWI